MKLFIISILTLLSFASHALDQDSLYSYLKSDDLGKQAWACIKLEHKYRNSQPDSAMYYIKEAYEIVTENIIDTLFTSVYNNLAISYKLLGNYDTTRYFFDLALKIAIENEDSAGISSAYNNMGVLYDDIGELDKALSYFILSAEIAEMQHDIDGMALSNNNIGMIHYKLENFVKARYYYEIALEQRIQMEDTNKIALLYNNIGILYYYENEPQKCLDYFKKALKIWENVDNKRETALVLSNIGELYYELQIYQSAMNYLTESQRLYNLLSDVHGELSVINLLGQVYDEWGNIDKAIVYYKKSLEIAFTIDAKTEIVNASLNLAKAYTQKKDYKTSNEYLTQYIEYKDSLFSADKSRSMQEVQAQYETEKKEQEIELLNKKNELSVANLNKQKIISWALVIGVGLVLILVVLIIHENRIRKKSNDTLMLKNNEILQQNEEIISQRDEIEAQRDMVNVQKEQIELIHQHVSQSIDYAERIQNATLPNASMLANAFQDHFVYFLPRDVVSGDFYWWANVENQTIVAAADSTGHGVPGAFMSMLGMSFLKEIVIKEYITHPGVILRKMRKEIINTLKQKGTIGEQKDGMDMALITFNHDTKILQYSGANNPLYIVKKGHIDIENESIKLYKMKDSSYSLLEIKPDKMPIAIYDKMDRFATQEIPLEEGDILYMFSDGYADQFGGPKGKKFKYKAFKNLLLQIAHLSMDEQKKELNKVLKDWMYHEDQVDDILVLGLKV